MPTATNPPPPNPTDANPPDANKAAVPGARANPLLASDVRHCRLVCIADTGEAGGPGALSRLRRQCEVWRARDGIGTRFRKTPWHRVGTLARRLTREAAPRAVSVSITVPLAMNSAMPSVKSPCCARRTAFAAHCSRRFHHGPLERTTPRHRQWSGSRMRTASRTAASTRPGRPRH